ncbi:hypothetical protein Pdw03_7606 [Penicillium digitatum]|uniref:Uncharacterized protein n=1 Tax=Penicillium digitatum TaxID=36651 RepID=A0A7T6XMF1_PENDI|nr:hypothetical protein Pdw03_7606 [Penicillium digitatum]
MSIEPRALIIASMVGMSTSQVYVAIHSRKPVRCGSKITPSGKSGFCRSPALKNIRSVVYSAAYGIHTEAII